jgi:hypothetical protein
MDFKELGIRDVTFRKKRGFKVSCPRRDSPKEPVFRDGDLFVTCF